LNFFTVDNERNDLAFCAFNFIAEELCRAGFFVNIKPHLIGCRIT